MPNLTKVYLLNTPLEGDMKNTLYFSSASAQHTYMESKTVRSYNKLSYQRENLSFRCPTQIDNIRSCNYMMFQNSDYSGKWFYCFIKRMTYISDGVTEVQFEVDPLQTYMFDVTIKPSFVEREHTNDDTIGKNLLPENLEHGEYVCNDHETMHEESHTESFLFVVNADKAPDTSDTNTYYSTNVGGIPMSGGLFVFTNMETLTNAFLTYSSMNGGIDHVKNVYIASDQTGIWDALSDPLGPDDEHIYRKYNGSSSPSVAEKTVSVPNTINGYTPRNKKLLSAPYQYMIISNNNGSANTLQYEFFSDRSNAKIKREGMPTVGGSVFYYPENYKGLANNRNEGVMGGKLPTLSWSGDAWTNWLTQNSVNLGFGTVSTLPNTALGVAGSVSTGNAIGAVGSVIGGIEGIGSQLVEMYNHSILPNTFSGNINGGDVITSSKRNELIIYHMSITSQFAKIIDDYFDMFGYATHRVKVPNSNHRTNYWYTKTIDCNIVGNVPDDYMQQIKNAYNNGLTFWKNPANFLDYSVNNAIV